MILLMKTRGHADLFLPPNNPKVGLHSRRLSDEFNWSMTLVEILDNITWLVIFYSWFYNILAYDIWPLRIIIYNYSNAVPIGIQLPEGEVIET